MWDKFKIFIIKLLLLIVIFISTLIVIKDNDKKEWIKNNVLEKNISFTYLKKEYTKYFGNVLPFLINFDSEMVFKEELTYSNINKYYDGVMLSVSYNYLVPALKDGIVVFIGEKENYGKTLIIENDNETIWYSNINANVNLYDEIKEGQYLGDTIDDKLYLVFKKDGVILDYKKYIE